VASTTTTVQTPTCRRKDFHDSKFRDYLQPIGLKHFSFATLKADLHFGKNCPKLGLFLNIENMVFVILKALA
jgi:hypothetical protein